MRSLVGFSLMTSLNEKSLLLPPSSINSARSCLHTKRPGPFFPTSFQTRNDRDSRREEESGAYASGLETLTHFLRQRPSPAGGQPCSGRFRRSMRQRANSDWRSFLRMRIRNSLIANVPNSLLMLTIPMQFLLQQSELCFFSRL